MERSTSDPLPCPRCNSSNTKFCYYNNYNLSQPRHFCKSCKRYWTRGGTLRNVPVGGGCRKNKKFKRHPTSNGGGADSKTALAKPFSLQPSIDNPSPSYNPINNTYFHSFPTELNFPFSATRVSSESPRFDDLRGPGSGFSVSPDYRNHAYEQNIGSSSFGPSPAMATLQRFAACDELSSLVVGNGEIGKETTMFEGEVCANNQIEKIQSSNSSSSSSFVWNSNSVGVWFDPSSSVPSLI